ncbi:MAG: hypothetical protein AMJ92_01390 [candidate division Zixibacteria bacterium SM23_81]|nr:MAG: hypothetical protein AMJ92_01390 [candidate division Zixibacteria bacterium SM23_81]
MVRLQANLSSPPSEDGPETYPQGDTNIDYLDTFGMTELWSRMTICAKCCNFLLQALVALEHIIEVRVLHNSLKNKILHGFSGVIWQPGLLAWSLHDHDDQLLGFLKKLSNASTVFGEHEKGGWFP